MNQWLFDILKNNTLVDNQTYLVANRVLNNQRLKEPIKLAAAGRRTQARHKDWLIWDFLFNTSADIKRLLKEDNTLVLFNEKEYENNTDDDFFEIYGKDVNNFTLKTGNLIGYVKKGDYAIKISSRFGDEFLKEIIADTDGFITLEEYGANSNTSSYEWLLVYLWKIKLKKAFRLGLPKEYVSKTNRLNKVKGNIDVLDYFLTNTGKYQCTYREHSYNNLGVQLITKVFNLYQGHSFLQDMHVIKNTFITATNGERTSLGLLKSTNHYRNPFYSDYNEVIDMSKMLLNNKAADFGDENNNNAFFFDISMLFEYFIKKTAISLGFEVESKFKKPYRVETGSLGNFKRKLEPDLVINTDKGQFVFDVKYKSYDPIFGVSREDVFQLHTYIGQYGNYNNIIGSGFILPISEKKASNYQIEGIIKQEVRVMNKSLPFYILFLIIPESKDSKQFKESFRKNKMKFIEQFQSIIN